MDWLDSPSERELLSDKTEQIPDVNTSPSWPRSKSDNDLVYTVFVTIDGDVKTNGLKLINGGIRCRCDNIKVFIK